MQVKILEPALADLQMIKEWRFKNGDQIVESCLKAINRLELSPNIGIPLRSKIDLETDFKYLINKPFLIFYKVKEHVMIYRIMDARQDYLGQLLRIEDWILKIRIGLINFCYQDL